MEPGSKRQFPNTDLNRHDFLTTALAGGLAAVWRGNAGTSYSDNSAFELSELSIANLQTAMQSGKYTSRSLAEKYLARIEAIDRQGPALRSVIEVNADALTLADALDKERNEKGPRGPLHGIPILIKDNIDHGRSDEHHGRLAGADWLETAPGCRLGSKAAPGWSSISRQNKSQRVGQYQVQLLHERLERARRVDEESVRVES